MSDVLVLAPGEMVAGLRLAGIHSLPVRNAGDLAERLRDVAERGDVELVLVPEDLLAGLEPLAYRQALDSDQPYVVPLPLAWRAATDAWADFEARLTRILGCRINLAAALRRRGGGPPP